MQTKLYFFLRPALLLGAVLLLGVTSCREAPENSLKTESVAFTKEGTLTLYRGESDSLLARLDIEIAETEYETQTGLMYRKSMEERQGMLFIFPNEARHSFYMKNTLIPLDILFIRGDRSIANIARNAQPMDESGIPSAGPVQYVLEINAGLSDRWGLKEGDRVVFERNP